VPGSGDISNCDGDQEEILRQRTSLTVIIVNYVPQDKTQPMGKIRTKLLPRIFKGATPFWVAKIILAIILTVFPEIVTFLPGLMK
jgi:hypothetical protein